jgi:hypothetical protein
MSRASAANICKLTHSGSWLPPALPASRKAITTPIPDHRDMIEHQVDVGPIQQPRQPLPQESRLYPIACQAPTEDLSGISVFISHSTRKIHLAA